jgi:hypothetical protein
LLIVIYGYLYLTIAFSNFSFITALLKKLLLGSETLREIFAKLPVLYVYRTFELNKYTKKGTKSVYLMPGSAYDGWEDSSGCIIAGKASLAHTGTIVHNQSRYFVVTHSIQ